MTTDENRERVRDAVRRTLGASPLANTGSWFVEGVYRGVPMWFSYSAPPDPHEEDLGVWTTIGTEIPGDYPLHLRLEPRTDDQPRDPRAAFFATLQGKAAPLDIVTRLLDAQICDDLRLLGRFTLNTYRAKLAGPSPFVIDLSVPGWVEDAGIADRMIDVLGRLVLSLEDARRAADAAAGASTGPYRSIGPDPEELHKKRLAEVEAVRVNVDWFVVPWLAGKLSRRAWILIVLLAIAWVLVERSM
jgi:hypothetical protein